MAPKLSRRTRLSNLFRPYLHNEYFRGHMSVLLPLIPLGLLGLALQQLIVEPEDESLGQLQGRDWILITSGWGKFTFAAVKGIDVAWDWVVGRGWQAFSASLVYVVFRRCLALHWKAAQGGIPVDAIMALQFLPTSPRACWTYLCVLFRRTASSWRITFDTMVLLSAAIYVILAPTWLAAMTGYIVPTLYGLPIGQKLVNVDNMKTCDYVIGDGERIGARTNTCVSVWDDRGGEFAALDNYMNRYYPNGSTPIDWDLRSTFNRSGTVYDLSAPLLNITQPLSTVRSYDGQLYSADQVSRSEIAMPANYYQWGFSFGLTFLFLIATLLIGLALYIVWLSSFWGTELADSIFGSLKTPVKVAEALVQAVEADVHVLSNAELEVERKRLGVAVPISTGELPVSKVVSKPVYKADIELRQLLTPAFPSPGRWW